MKKWLLILILVPVLVLIPDDSFAQKKSKPKPKTDPTWAMSKKSKKVNRKLSGKKKKKTKKVSSLGLPSMDLFAYNSEKRGIVPAILLPGVK